ncbi:MAG: SCO family protein [Rhodospirillaceae bacterium]
MNWIRRHGLMLAALVLIGAGMLWIKQSLLRDGGGSSEITFELGGPFRLTAGDGRPVNETSWPGKRLLISFGYRFCPDVCPTNLQTIAKALDLLGDDAGSVQPLFVTIDPERDPPSVLTDYVTQFHPRLIGLSGTAAEIAAIAKAFRVYYAKVPGSDAANYSMDHSAFFYLTDDHGKVRRVFGHDTKPEAIAAAVRVQLRK